MDHQFNRATGSDQGPMPVVLGGNSRQGSSSGPVFLMPNNAFNVFMMSPGQTSLQVSYHPSALNPTTGSENLSVMTNSQRNSGLHQFSQQPQQQQQPRFEFNATGTTVTDLTAKNATLGRQPRNAGGRTGSVVAVAVNAGGRVTRSKSKTANISEPPSADQSIDSGHQTSNSSGSEIFQNSP